MKTVPHWLEVVGKPTIYTQAQSDALFAKLSGGNSFTGNQAVTGNLNIANSSYLSVDGGQSATLQNVSGLLSIGNLFGGTGIRFRDWNGTEWARINNSGRMLVGTTTDDTVNRFQVGGSSAFNGTVRVDSNTVLDLRSSVGVQFGQVTNQIGHMRVSASSSGYALQLYGNANGIRIGDGTYTVDLKPVGSNSVLGIYTGQGNTPASGALASLNVAAGANGNPAIRFGSDTTTGFWQPTANQIGVTIQGNDVFRWAVGGLVYCFAQTFQPYGDILFGSSGGPRLRNSSGTLLLRNNADTANGDFSLGSLTTSGNINMPFANPRINILANTSSTGGLDFCRTGETSPIFSIEQTSVAIGARRASVRGEGLQALTDAGTPQAAVSQYGIRAAQGIGFEFCSSTTNVTSVVHRLMRDAAAATIDSHCDNGFRSRNFANNAFAPIACNRIEIEGAAGRAIRSSGGSFITLGGVGFFESSFNINDGSFGMLSLKLQTANSSTQGNIGAILQATANTVVIRNAANNAAGDATLANLTASGTLTVPTVVAPSDLTLRATSSTLMLQVSNGGFTPCRLGPGVLNGPSQLGLSSTNNASVPNVFLNAVSSGEASLTSDSGKTTGGNLTLGNLTASGNILASANGTQNIGSTSNYFGTLHVGTIRTAGSLNLNTTGTGYGLISSGSNGFWDADTFTIRNSISVARATFAPTGLTLTGELVANAGTFSGTLLATNANNNGRLEVRNGSAGNLVILGDSGTGNVTINNTNSVGGDLVFQTRGTERFRVAGATGNLTFPVASSNTGGSFSSNIWRSIRWTAATAGAPFELSNCGLEMPSANAGVWFANVSTTGGAPRIIPNGNGLKIASDVTEIRNRLDSSPGVLTCSHVRAETQLSVGSTGSDTMGLTTSGNTLIARTWDGFNVNFGNGAGNVLAINNLANATFSGFITSGFRSLSADPTTLDIAAGQTQLVKNTTSGVIKLWANDGGTMKSVALS